MESNKEALDLIQKCLNDRPYAAIKVIEIMARLERVKELLKEHEAVEPTVSGTEEHDGHGSWWYQCGKCKTPIDYKDKFCRFCGSAVKWK